MTGFSDSFVGIIDANFLRAEGAKILKMSPNSVRPDASQVVNWFNIPGKTFLRAYWYDSAFDPSHASYSGQRTFFDAIAMTPGLQLRLGHIVEFPSPIEQPLLRALSATLGKLDLDEDAFMAEFHKQWRFRPTRQQKGVDTLITLDMVRLASRPSCSMIILIAGDRDFSEPVRVAQDFGVRVVLATPNRGSVSRELAQLVDDTIDISVDILKGMLIPRPGYT